MNLPPSIEAMLEHFASWDRLQILALAHEACRLQREADIDAGFVGPGYADDLRRRPLVVPSPES